MLLVLVNSSPALTLESDGVKQNRLLYVLLSVALRGEKQGELQGTSDFGLRSQGPCRLGTGESGLVLG